MSLPSRNPNASFALPFSILFYWCLTCLSFGGFLGAFSCGGGEAVTQLTPCNSKTDVPSGKCFVEEEGPCVLHEVLDQPCSEKCGQIGPGETDPNCYDSGYQYTCVCKDDTLRWYRSGCGSDACQLRFHLEPVSDGTPTNIDRYCQTQSPVKTQLCAAEYSGWLAFCGEEKKWVFCELGCLQAEPEDACREKEEEDPPEQTPPDVSIELSVPYHSQLLETDSTRWNPYSTCGPAALLMVLDLLDLEDKLSPVIEFVDAIDPQDGGYDPTCSSSGNPVCTSPSALDLVAKEQYGLTTHVHEGWTLDDVRDQLKEGHPVLADVNVDLDPKNAGHFVVIVGMTQDSQGTRLLYHDPFRQAKMTASWETFSNSWKGPVDINDPLLPAGHSYWAMATNP